MNSIVQNRHYSLLFYIFAVSVLIAILASEKAYFFWWLNENYANFFSLICGLLYFNGRLKNPKGGLIIFILYVVALFWMTHFTIVGHVALLIKGFLVLLLMMLTREEQKKIVSIITKFFYVSFGISTFLYLVSLLITLPSLGSISFGNYEYTNYFFFIENVKAYDYARFSAFLLEPGHLAVFCIFLLFINDFDLSKKHNIIFVISIIVSFSLAGYILLPISYFLYCLVSRKSVSKSILYIIIVLVAVVLFSQRYNNGNNTINHLIISRLEQDEDKGIVGNNRNQLSVDIALISAFSNGDIIKGYGDDVVLEKYTNEYGQLGAGYKVFILSKGLVGTLCLLILYVSLVYKGENRRKSWGLLIIYILVFLAQEYLLWFSWISIFILGTNVRFSSRKISSSIIKS